MSCAQCCTKLKIRCTLKQQSATQQQLINSARSPDAGVSAEAAPSTCETSAGCAPCDAPYCGKEDGRLKYEARRGSDADILDHHAGCSTHLGEADGRQEGNPRENVQTTVHACAHSMHSAADHGCPQQAGEAEPETQWFRVLRVGIFVMLVSGGVLMGCTQHAERSSSLT